MKGYLCHVIILVIHECKEMISVYKIIDKFKRKKDGSEYEFHHLAQKFFIKKFWYFKKPDIKIHGNKNRMTIESKSETVNYVTLFEGNTSFSSIQRTSNKIKLNRNNSIIINAEVVGDINVILYLIEYDQNYQQVEKHKLTLNKMFSFEAHPAGVYARIAVRISGEGAIHFQHVFTSPYLPESLNRKKSIHKLSDIKMACFLDDDTFNGFSNVVSAVSLSLDNWEKELREQKPDFLLVDSSQIQKKWSNQFPAELMNILLWCKTNSIPALFWDVSSHGNDGAYLNVAEPFNYILASDYHVLQRYKKTKNRQLYYMPLAVTPNVLEGNKTKPEVSVFYDGKKTTLQQFSTNKISIKKVDIRQERASNYTKFLLEDIAKGNLIFCDRHIPISDHLKDAISVFRHEKEINSRLENLLKKPDLYQSKVRNGVREIFKYHTYEQNVIWMLKRLNIKYTVTKPTVTLVFRIDSKESFYRAMTTLESQTWGSMNGIFLFSVFDGYDDLINQYGEEEQITIYMEKYATRYYTVNKITNATYLGILNPERNYDRHYVEDVIHVMEHYSRNSIGKRLNPESEFPFHDNSIQQDSNFFLKRKRKRTVPLKDVIRNNKQKAI